MELLNGYKTYIGGAIIAIASIVDYAGYPPVGALLRELGMALGLVGIAHKVQKQG